MGKAEAQILISLFRVCVGAMENREPITIFLRSQFEFFPIDECRFGDEFVVGLYARLNKASGYPYKNLNLQDDPQSLSTTRIGQHGKEESCCNVRPHSICVQEDAGLGSVGLDEFLETLKAVLNAARETASELKRPIPPIMVQRVQVQSIVQPSHASSPLILLAGQAASVLHRIEPFKRPPAAFGMRFRFRPHDPDDYEGEDFELPDLPGWNEKKEDSLTLRFETWSRDPDYLWMEASSMRILPNPFELEKAADISALCANVSTSHNFLWDNGIEFLKQFDIVDDGNEGDGDETDSKND